ncbi:MAG: hypothetical protein M1831_002210 [Alyxoria varia]|nr:MAG: hypothetical protein M1831_002210 [Alyxoria varia]
MVLPTWMEAPDREAASRREWNRVWQSVHRRTNIDLDFPFSDESDLLPERTEAERREFQEWNRRFQIAERQGGVGPANAILQARDGRSGRGRRGTPQEEGESQDEIRAWNAFDKARQILDHPEPTNTTNKRKSRPASPVESGQEARPSRALKKPRTRRVQPTNDQQPETNGESSSSAAPAPPPANGTSQPLEGGGAAPSFLQSLLKEVESGPPAVDRTGSHRLSLAGLNQTSDPSSPGSPGFGGSLASSNHSSPRGRSPSPGSQHSSRSSSPPPLASRIEPNYSGRATSRLSYSPVSPVQVAPQLQDSNATRATSPTHHGSNGNSPSRSANHPRIASSPRAGSPSRQNLSVPAKEEVQKLVRGVLESEWNKQFINRDQYTEINRDVSRKLYEMVGNGEDLTQPENRQRWVAIAAKEVKTALQVLKPSIKIPDDGR